jgi:hypothetical protein
MSVLLPNVGQRRTFFMEAPDVTPSFSAIPAFPSDELAGFVQHDIEKKEKRFNYHDWEIATIIYACHAAGVVEASLTVQFRSQYLRNYYSKYVRIFFQVYGLQEGHGGTHTAER